MEHSSLEPKLQMSPAMRILLLLSLALAGLILCSVVMFVFMMKGDKLEGDVVYATIILQDVLVFIVPALLAIALCFRRPLHAMDLNRAPSWKGLALVVLVCVASLPAMNWLVEWNKSMHLPDSLAQLEQWMQTKEQQGEVMTQNMLNDTSVGGLVINLLVVGLLAGLSEEIFFRGGMLKMLRPRDKWHVAIWVVAIVFSAIHLQFYGFVPRLLLGAWFGYLLWWTRSLWVPIIAHTLNNSVVVVSSWLAERGMINSDSIDTIGLAENGQMPLLALASAIVTVALILCARRFFFQKNELSE